MLTAYCLQAFEGKIILVLTSHYQFKTIRHGLLTIY